MVPGGDKVCSALRGVLGASWPCLWSMNQGKELPAASRSGLYHQAGAASLRQRKQNKTLIAIEMNGLIHLESCV